MAQHLQIYLTFLTLVSSTLGTSTPDILHPTIQNLFQKLEHKHTPLFLCKGWASGLLYKIPPPINCPLLAETQNSTVKHVTFWWHDITKAQITSYECYRITTVVRKSYFFFGTYSQDKKSNRHAVTEAECRYMIWKQKTLTGLVMSEEIEGFWATTEPTEVEYSWPHTIIKEVDNYYYVTLQISVNNLDNTIISASKLTEKCTYHKGICQTENGILLWLSSDYNPCRLVKGQSTTCLVTNNRMSCPKLQIAISHISTSRICDLNIGHSAQGVMFSQDPNDEPFEGIAYTSDKEQKINGKKSKRSTKQLKIKPDGQLNSEFTYLYETLKTNLTFGIQVVHREVGRAHQMELELVHALAEGGQPSVLVRSLMQDRRYRATANGDGLSIFKCEEIHKYKFLQQNNCTKEFQLEYYHKHEIKTGWLEELSHQILDTPTYVIYTL